jgi:hypothetical protein
MGAKSSDQPFFNDPSLVAGGVSRRRRRLIPEGVRPWNLIFVGVTRVHTGSIMNGIKHLDVSIS